MSDELPRQSYPAALRRPVHGGYPQAAAGMVAVRMSSSAAARLAEACRWAAGWASELWDGHDVMATPPRRERAIPAYEWLSWGAEWLRNKEARTSVG
jgi:hypothetical protein